MGPNFVAKYQSYKSSFCFIWRNLQQGKRICEQGITWAIGEGKHVNLWEHRWIPDSLSLRSLIHGPLTKSEQNLTLDKFWTSSGWSWDSLSLFIPTETTAKVRLLFLNPGTKDMLYWPLQTSGKPTTGSFRHLITLHRESTYTLHWVWSLCIPLKIQHLLWLCSHNRLSSNDHLYKLKILTSSACPLCYAPQETITHIFLECHMIKKIWPDLGLNMHFIVSTPTHWLTNLHQLNIPLATPSLLGQEFYLFALWNIWTQRNDHVFRRQNTPPICISYSKILMRALEYKHLAISPCFATSTAHIPVCWTPPPLDPNTGLKVNTNETFLEKSQEGGIGRVIRDSQGNWIIGFQAKTHAYNPVVRELKALENGLHLALTNHLHVTEVKSDSSEVVELLLQPTDTATYCSILSSCRLLLRK